MTRPFFLYPGGPAGAALVLLRLSTATSSVGVALSVARHGWPCVVPLVLIAAALVLGIGTRIAAAICVLLALGVMASGAGALMTAIVHLLDAMALAMLGPGALSIDARRYGLRVITSHDARR